MTKHSILPRWSVCKKRNAWGFVSIRHATFICTAGKKDFVKLDCLEFFFKSKRISASVQYPLLVGLGFKVHLSDIMFFNGWGTG